MKRGNVAAPRDSRHLYLRKVSRELAHVGSIPYTRIARHSDCFPNLNEPLDMEPLVYTPTYELFLVVDHPRRVLPELCTLLGRPDELTIPPQLGADAYYRSQTDVALLALRFDERRLTHRDLDELEQLAVGAGLALLDPARLSDVDRRRFYDSYLNSYEVQIEDLDDAGIAAAELLERLGGSAPRRARAGSVPMTAEDTQVPIFTDRRARTAPLQPPSHAGHPPPLPPVVAGMRLGSSPGDEDAEDTPVESAIDPVGGNRLATVREELDRELPSGPITSVEPAEPRGKQRQRTRRLTTPATPLAKQPKDRRGKVASGSGPHDAIDDAAAPPEIDARYLRGGDWVPARLRSLSLKGAYLVTGALPRPGDVVHLSLGFRGTGAMISGSVYHVTTVEDAAHTGSSGFAVRFESDDTSERRQLTALLKHARAAGISIKPPPARVAVRFPVEWPVRLGTRLGGIRGAVLDVSVGGMFLRTERELTTDEVVFRMPLDNQDAGITGRARPVRRVDDQMALERGLQRGYGLVIVELSDLDERRWSCFLERVRRRTERRILIASARTRGRELADGLRSSGYAVSLACDHTAVFELLRTGSRPPDVAVIDPSFVADVADRRRIETALATLAVPQVTPPGAVTEARAAVDRMLLSV